jgi:phosphatidylserine/phosphatidylglycerophosphate/cardiolipin synthase-like enzyme
VSDAAYTVPLIRKPDEAVIRILEAVLEDARRGGVTSIAMITVNSWGLVQTPCQGGQIREIAQGVEKLRGDIDKSYAQAVECIGKYTSKP